FCITYFTKVIIFIISFKWQVAINFIRNFIIYLIYFVIHIIYFIVYFIIYIHNFFINFIYFIINSVCYFIKWIFLFFEWHNFTPLNNLHDYHITLLTLNEVDFLKDKTYIKLST